MRLKMEQKAFHAVNYKAKGDGDRTRTGIAAVFGNIDSGGDITHPGAFTKTLSEGRARWKHLWNHNSHNPPIAKPTEIKEVGRGELPAEILEYAPDATGGLWVKRDYLSVPEADWVLAAIDAGAVDEMSFAYDIIKSDNSEIDGKAVRNLRELALFDTSDVNWGMNPATVGAGAKNLFTMMPLGSILQMLQMHEAEIKAGRRNNHIDQLLINGLHDIALSLGCDPCKVTEEPKAEAVHADTSLIAQRLSIQKMRLNTVRTI